jgi:hypothetical protein
MRCAVTQRLCGLSRLATIGPMSSGRPTRPRAVMAANCALSAAVSRTAPPRKSVSIAPGERSWQGYPSPKLPMTLATKAFRSSHENTGDCLVSHLQRTIGRQTQRLQTGRLRMRNLAAVWRQHWLKPKALRRHERCSGRAHGLMNAALVQPVRPPSHCRARDSLTTPRRISVVS